MKRRERKIHKEEKEMEREIMIFLAIILLVFWWIKNSPKKTETINRCSGQCGGFSPSGMHTECTEGCRCADFNPNIPDAPRNCIPA